MSAKRRQSIKREAYKNFVPNYPPDFRYNGKVLNGTYDKSCYLEGHNKAAGEHDSLLKREKQAKEIDE